jgi:hypothetical protein
MDRGAGLLMRVLAGHRGSASFRDSATSFAIGSRRTSGFLDNPELELSNNLVENSMRPITLGRGNWIHIRSRQAGPRLAV